MSGYGQRPDGRRSARGRADVPLRCGGTDRPARKTSRLRQPFSALDIRILEGGAAARPDFDCNRSAKKKTYCYSLYVSKREIPLKERFSVRVEDAPLLAALRSAAALFEGEHDFKAFCASGSSVKTTVRTVYSVRVEEGETFGGRDLKIYVCGNGFLYNMVRTMAGELLDIASGRRSAESLREAFVSGRRELLGKTMPAKGLTLMNVDYEEAF